MIQADASALCESEGGRLAEVRNQEQFEKVLEISLTAPFRFWMGGVANPEDTTNYLWLSDSASIPLDVFWKAGEPNNAAELCVNFFISQGLNDARCDSLFHTLCEFGASGDVSVETCT